MARTKISEFSATPGSNTDIDGIDLSEGCAPSGINNAIRELMAQLKDMQTGTSGDTFTLTTVNSTTTDTTNLEVTNLKAQDGTAAGSIAGSTGVVTLASSVLTTTDINGGTVDGTTIGASSASTGAFTTLASNGATTFTAGTASTSTTTGTAVITGGLGVSGRINAANFDGIVGANTAAAGSFTNLAYTGTLTGGTGVINIGSGQVYKDASGNVGIGVTPGSPLAIKTANDARLRFQNNGATQLSQIQSVNLAETSYAPLSIGGLYTVLETGGQERVRVDASGNVGIGTVPSGKLDVVGGRSFFSAVSEPFAVGARYVSTGGTVYFGATDATATPGIQISFATGAVALGITSSGIVAMPAYGAGTATFSAAGVISSVSDETWKIKDGVPVDPDAMLQKLAPGYWYYNDEKKEIFGVERQLGFYAQNVNAAIGPEAAPTPEEGKPWGYYDRSVLAITVMSLQKALATIESLTARIETLEAK